MKLLETLNHTQVDTWTKSTKLQNYLDLCSKASLGPRDWQWSSGVSIPSCSWMLTFGQQDYHIMFSLEQLFCVSMIICTMEPRNPL